MKKFLAMLFLGAFVFAGVVGCGDDTAKKPTTPATPAKDAPTKDKK